MLTDEKVNAIRRRHGLPPLGQPGPKRKPKKKKPGRPKPAPAPEPDNPWNFESACEWEYRKDGWTREQLEQDAELIDQASAIYGHRWPGSWVRRARERARAARRVARKMQAK